MATIRFAWPEGHPNRRRPRPPSAERPEILRPRPRARLGRPVGGYDQMAANENLARQLQAEEDRIASNENYARRLARDEQLNVFDADFNSNGDPALAQRLSYANSNVDYENILAEHDYVRSSVLDTKPLSPVHVAHRPLPSVPTGPSTVSPSTPKRWDTPARPEVEKKEEKKQEKTQSQIALEFFNNNLIFFVIGLIALYLVFNTSLVKGSRRMFSRLRR